MATSPLETVVRFDVLGESRYTLIFSSGELKSITGVYNIQPLGDNTFVVEQELVDLINERLPGNQIAIEYFAKLMVDVYDSVYGSKTNDNGKSYIKGSLKELHPEAYNWVKKMWERNLPAKPGQCVSVVHSSECNCSYAWHDGGTPTPCDKLLSQWLKPAKPFRPHCSHSYTTKLCQDSN